MNWEQIELFEKWLAVVDYEGLYEVSDWGRVRSLARPRTPGKILIRCRGAGDYPVVTLCKEGKRKARQVHRLVAEAFLGPCPLGKQVDHIDGDRTNAVILNLRYVTSRENNLAMFKRVGYPKGTPKLSQSDAIEIRRLRTEGMKYKEIARIFSVTPSTIGYIVRGYTWRHSKEG